MSLKVCIHCGGERSGLMRGLCGKCYYHPRIRKMYPPTYKMVPCDHCGKPRKSSNRLPLCHDCQTNNARRSKYKRLFQLPDEEPEQLPMDTWSMGLRALVAEPVSAVPDLAARPFCRHGHLDGECPACERLQRAGMVFGGNRP